MHGDACFLSPHCVRPRAGYDFRESASRYVPCVPLWLAGALASAQCVHFQEPLP